MFSAKVTAFLVAVALGAEIRQEACVTWQGWLQWDGPIGCFDSDFYTSIFAVRCPGDHWSWIMMATGQGLWRFREPWIDSECTSIMARPNLNGLHNMNLLHTPWAGPLCIGLKAHNSTFKKKLWSKVVQDILPTFTRNSDLSLLCQTFCKAYFPCGASLLR